MQNNIIDTIRLDINRSSTNACVYIRRADTRTLEIFLTNNGNIVDISNALFAAIYIEKKGQTLYKTVIREGNKLRYTFHDDDVDVLGELRCRLVISLPDDIQITSPLFSVIVEEIPEIPIATAEDLQKYNALTGALSEASGYAASAKNDAERAEGAMSDAAVIYENIQILLRSTETLVDILTGIEEVTEDDIDAMWEGEYVPPNEMVLSDLEEQEEV